MSLFVRRKGKRKIPAVGFIFCEASPSRRSLFFEIFSHARVYARGDDEKKKIYFLYIFLFFYFTLFYLLVLKQPLLVLFALKNKHCLFWFYNLLIFSILKN